MSKVEWYSLNGEKREWFDGMVEATFAVDNDETVSVVTHESVKDIALNYIPKREWVGLTDEEAREIRLRVGSASDVYARAIEAALKEKNA